MVLQTLPCYNPEQGELQIQTIMPRIAPMSDAEKEVFFRTMINPTRSSAPAPTLIQRNASFPFASQGLGKTKDPSKRTSLSLSFS